MEKLCSSIHVQILTEELKYHSMLGIGLFTRPRDIKITRDRVLVLEMSDPCMLIFFYTRQSVGVRNE